ncbi:MAG: sulfatase-like hydrolase/transferase [Actinomycetota bacterium]|nr:sulfatase-like hydrolase/transferase [Actinomycetota bacterium]
MYRRLPPRAFPVRRNDRRPSHVPVSSGAAPDARRLGFGRPSHESRGGALHLFVLSAFAIAQPLFAIFRESPEFFVARRIGGGELVAFTLLLLVVPPALAVACVRLVRAVSPAWSSRVLRLFVAVFGALTALTVLRSLGEGAASAVALAAGLVLARTYRPSSRLGTFLSLGAPAPALFAGIFLLTAPMSTLVLGRDSQLPTPQVRATNPVVFVVFDELPAVSLLDGEGRINARRFPNLASLSERATWFPTTGSVHPFTPHALPAILSGSLPPDDAVPTSTSYPINLFTVLGGSHRVHAVEPVTQLCPPTVCLPRPELGRGRVRGVGSLLGVSTTVYARAALPKSLGTWSGDSPDPFGEFLAVPGAGGSGPTASTRGRAAEELDRSDEFGRFVEALQPGHRQLYFAHALLPHAPFEYLPSGTRYPIGPILEGLSEEYWTSEEPWLPEFSRRRHLLQLRHVDHLVGELVARLEALGMYDETLLVITADHGVSFEPGAASRLVTEDNKYEVGLVPLIMKLPFQTVGAVHFEPVRTIDVVPTILGLLDVDHPLDADGRDVFAPDVTVPPLRIRDTVGRAWVDLDDAPRELRRAARRLAWQLGDGSSVYDLHDGGPHGHLIGRQVADLPVDGDLDLVASLTDGEGFHQVDLEAGVVPAIVAGVLPGPLPPRTFVAVALNGRVGTVVPTYPVHDGTRFVSLLPDHLFVNGTNHLELLAVLGSGTQGRFLAVPYSPGEAPKGLDSPRSSEVA